MTASAPRGRFITLEGGEGVGKSTQLPRLASALRARGVAEVVTTREPGGTAGAEIIRDILLSGSADRWGPRAEAMLFAAARADHVDRVIRPAIGRGAWVVCDRFVDSTRAYQGAGGGLSDVDILDLHRIASANLMPDLTLLLTLPQDERQQRTLARDGNAPDRMGARDQAFHSAVNRSLLGMAASDPVRFRLIAADGTIEDVTARLISAVNSLG